MKIELDCKKLNTKAAVLNELQKHYAEMFSANYDAFIDAATNYFDEEVILVVNNAKNLDDLQSFTEVLQIIRNENNLFCFEIA